eukprot:TRINITY_DN1782_c0_g1_i5.p1 TRINITY_DN1782_c0_g1~~TRINITY_DN1782_c0_g1_i5.p1  ORF type:complete len:192 (-),score=64.54 TRINITY_DN1782_c0_g1_i5:106-681(-)
MEPENCKGTGHAIGLCFYKRMGRRGQVIRSRDRVEDNLEYKLNMAWKEIPDEEKHKYCITAQRQRARYGRILDVMTDENSDNEDKNTRPGEEEFPQEVIVVDSSSEESSVSENRPEEIKVLEEKAGKEKSSNVVLINLPTRAEIESDANASLSNLESSVEVSDFSASSKSENNPAESKETETGEPERREKE